MASNPVSSDLLRIYMDAMEMIQQGVIWLNQDGHILGVNSHFARESGYSRFAFNSKTIFQVSPNTSFISWRNFWRDLLEKEQLTIETEHITADGAIYPVRMRGVLIDTGETPICCCMIENLLTAHPFKDLLELTAQVTKVGSWQWNLIQQDLLFTDEIYDLLCLPQKFATDIPNLKKWLEQRLNAQEFANLTSKVKQSLKAGERFETEISVKLPDSEQHRQLRIIGIPVFVEGRTVKLYGTLQDISNITTRTDELYLTQYCLNNAREIIYWLTPEGSFRYVNDVMALTLGYTREELLRMKLMDVRSNCSEIHWQYGWEQVRKDRTLEMELDFICRDGKILPIHVIANHMQYRGEELLCVFGRDLSKTKQRDELIKLTYHSLNQSDDMIYWLRLDGSFIYFNNTLCEKTGYHAEEINQMKMQHFFPEYSEEDFQHGWERLRKGQILNNDKLVITGKNGKKIPVESYVTLVAYNGEQCCCGILRDISERKQKEQELQDAFEQIKLLKDQLEADNKILKEEIELEYSFNNIISKSSGYKKVLRQVEQVAETAATVLILGETGTGKELLARAVHQLSNRANRPMVKINCGALPESLVESELFGHEKGAFTGAYKRKKGRFEMAQHGTIFLDEIAELPLNLQAKLLRVLQEGEFERIGSTETIKVDVRVITATNRDLERLVKEKKFREDLFYRLNVFPIYNIPLRERPEDIPLLVRHFVEKFGKKMGKQINEIPQSVLEKLQNYPFPGNVRELENLIERAVILSKGRTLNPDTASLNFSVSEIINGSFKSLEEIQRDHILEALHCTKGRISGENGAASLLKMHTKTLVSRMKKLGIERKDYLQIE